MNRDAWQTYLAGLPAACKLVELKLELCGKSFSGYTTASDL